MTRPDEPGGVHFVLDGPDAPVRPDEQLTGSRPRRGRVVAGGAALAAVVAVVVVRGEPSTGHPAATRSPAPHPSSSAPPTAIIGASGVSTLPSLETPAACPAAGDGRSACVTVHTVPAAFRAAVHQVFPRLTHAVALTEQLRAAGSHASPAGLWARQFSARAGRVSLVVVVNAAAAGVAEDDSGDDGRHTVVYSSYSAGGYTVQVRLSAPSGYDQSFYAVSRLARDPRLRALR